MSSSPAKPPKPPLPPSLTRTLSLSADPAPSQKAYSLYLRVHRRQNRRQTRNRRSEGRVPRSNPPGAGMDFTQRPPRPQVPLVPRLCSTVRTLFGVPVSGVARLTTSGGVCPPFF